MHSDHVTLTWHIAFLIAALVCSVLATAKIGEPTRFAWLGGTLMFLILGLIFVSG